MDLNFSFVARHIRDGLKIVEEENIDRELWPGVIATGLMNDWRECQRAERQKMSDIALALVMKRRGSKIMPSSPIRYEVVGGTGDVLIDEVKELHGGNYAINTSSRYTQGDRLFYYLMCQPITVNGLGDPENEWGEVENIEGVEGETSCDFLRTINDAFQTRFMCSDGGWDCLEDNPGNEMPCKVRPEHV